MAQLCGVRCLPTGLYERGASQILISWGNRSREREREEAGEC
jgi:hypothetical protein